MGGGRLPIRRRRHSSRGARRRVPVPVTVPVRVRVHALYSSAILGSVTPHGCELVIGTQLTCILYFCARGMYSSLAHLAHSLCADIAYFIGGRMSEVGPSPCPEQCRGASSGRF